MKKLLIGFGALLGVLVIAMAVIPLFYDVNTKVRPQIIEAIESQMDVKTELGKLSLSLWGRVSIGIESLNLIDKQTNASVFSMKDAKLNIPFLSLLAGKLSITLATESPQLLFIQEKKGQNNFSRLMKPQAASAKTTNTEAKPSGGGTSGAERISFSTVVKNAKITYKDMVNQRTSVIENLDLILQNVGIGQPMQLDVSSVLHYSQGKEIQVDGPVQLKGTSEVHMADGKIEHLTVTAELDLSKLAVKYAGLLNKQPDVPLTANLSIAQTNEKIDFKTVELVADKFEINMKGTVEGFENPKFDLQITSNDLQLEKWQKIIAPIGAFQVAGLANVKLGLNGTLAQPQYNGEISLRDGSMKIPGVIPLAQAVTVKSVIQTDEVKLQEASMKIGQSDISMNGLIKNLSAPSITFAIKSARLNLDEMMGPSTSTKKSAEEKKAAANSGKGETEQADSTAAIRNNDFMKKMSLAGQFISKEVILSQVKMEDVLAEVQMKNLVFELKKAQLKTLKGTAQVQALVDLKPVDPTYKVSGKVANMDLNEGVTSQFAALKDFVTGEMKADFAISGAGTQVAKVKRNLRGGGQFEVVKGTWSGLSPLKLVGEKLSSIPGAKDKLGQVVVGNKFKTLKGKFELRDSQLVITSADAELEEGRTGFQLAGNVGFDLNMKMNGHLLSPMSDVPKSLRASDGRGKIPFEMEGQAMSPNVKWEATVKPVASAFVEQEGKKVLEKGLDKLKENVKDQKIQDLIKGIKF